MNSLSGNGYIITTNSLTNTTPTGSVTLKGGAAYTNATAIGVGLAASDDVGITGYYLSTNATKPLASASGWVAVAATANYSATVSYTLSTGDGTKTLYAHFKDAAGNVSTTTSDSIVLDTTLPTVAITTPTSNSVYIATSSPMALGGSASDTLSNISSVTWSNSRGGSGAASGTGSWSASGINLQSGDNIITVTAKDGANNIKTDTLTVTYNASSAPTVTTGSASSITSNSVALNGSANPNGLATTVWFQYGTVSGSYVSTSATKSINGTSETQVSIALSGLTVNKTYYYRIVAQNSKGTTYGSQMSFVTVAASSVPTGNITINNGAAYTKTASVTMQLSATDDVGVTGYYLSTSSTKPLASASGWVAVPATRAYSASISYTLPTGDGTKTLYAHFKDAAGNVSNTASDSIVLDTIAPAIMITSPTSLDTYSTASSTMSFSGTAFDSVSGISSVTWSKTSGGSGIASGTTSWSITAIPLTSGSNTITVTSKDGAGNLKTDTINVTYTGVGTFSYQHPGGLYSKEQIAFIKSKIKNGEHPYNLEYPKLIAEANKVLAKADPYTSTPNPMATYNQCNTNQYQCEHTKILYADAKASLISAIAYVLSDDTRYCERTRQILNSWASINKNVTGSMGFQMAYIEWASGFIAAAELISEFTSWSTNERSQFNTWVSKVYMPVVVNHYRTSDQNHATTAMRGQALAAHWLNDRKLLLEVIEMYKQDIEWDIAPDGHMPKETIRAEKGLHYSFTNLQPLSATAQIIANAENIDLFNYKSRAGLGLKNAVDYAFYYLQHPYEWPWHDVITIPGHTHATLEPLSFILSEQSYKSYLTANPLSSSNIYVYLAGFGNIYRLFHPLPLKQGLVVPDPLPDRMNPLPDIVVDNKLSTTQDGSLKGLWEPLHERHNPFFGAGAIRSLDPTGEYIWKVPLVKPGKYNVVVWFPDSGWTDPARYTVFDNGVKVGEVVVDQWNKMTVGRWLSLGVFTFNTTNLTVRLVRNPAYNFQIVADAVGVYHSP